MAPLKWLEMTEMYCPTVLKARNPKSSIGEAMFPLKSVGESFLVSPQLLWFAGNLLHSLACSHTTTVSALPTYGILSVCLSSHGRILARTPVALDRGPRYSSMTSS